MKNVYFLFFLSAMVFRGLLCAEISYREPWGKGAKIIKKKDSIPDVPSSKNLATKAAEKVILFHQNIISPVDGPRSHFRPTSSRYMLLAMKRNGFLKGFIMGCDRLMRENQESWIYRTRLLDQKEYKWDPTYREVTPYGRHIRLPKRLSP